MGEVDPSISEWLLEEVHSFLKSPSWHVPIMEFLDDNCLIFDNEEENKFAYTEVHDKFKELVEFVLEGKLEDLGIPSELFVQVLEAAPREKTRNLVKEQILAVDDFLSFKKMMVRRNMELEVEAIRALEALGDDPEALHGYPGSEPGDDDDDDDDKEGSDRGMTMEEEEEAMLQEALKLSMETYEQEKGRMPSTEWESLPDDYNPENDLSPTKKKKERVEVLKSDPELNDLAKEGPAIPKDAVREAEKDMLIAQKDHELTMNIALEEEKLNNLADELERRVAEENLPAPSQHQAVEVQQGHLSPVQAPPVVSAIEQRVPASSSSLADLPPLVGVRQPPEMVKLSEEDLEQEVEAGMARQEALQQEQRMLQDRKEKRRQERREQRAAANALDDEQKLRQEQLRAAREKIRAKKRAEREKALQAAKDSAGPVRPPPAIHLTVPTADEETSEPTNTGPTEDEKRLQMRLALAQKLKAGSI